MSAAKPPEVAPEPVAVIGAGSWGTALAGLLGASGREVRLVARTAEAAARLQTTRENEVYLPGVMLEPSIKVTADLESALSGVALAVVAVPVKAVSELASRLSEAPPPRVLSASKGFERESLRTMTEVLERACGPKTTVAAISGPNLAREIAAGQPAAAVIACEDEACAKWIQRAFRSPRFRTYRSRDVVGVEIAGALKNILALAAGMLAELGYGANSQAALLTRGLAEMTRLGIAMGGDPRTFMGLAGMGDVLATCSSTLSRNFRAGRMAARGLNPDEIRKAIGQAVEGLATVEAACLLGKRHGVVTPLASEARLVLLEGKDPRAGARDLMTRPLKAE